MGPGHKAQDDSRGCGEGGKQIASIEAALTQRTLGVAIMQMDGDIEQFISSGVGACAQSLFVLFAVRNRSKSGHAWLAPDSLPALTLTLSPLRSATGEGISAQPAAPGQRRKFGLGRYLTVASLPLARGPL